MGAVHLLLQVLYLIINFAFLYVNAPWDLFNFSENVWNNIFTGLITIELKDFIYSFTFFVLIFAKELKRFLVYRLTVDIRPNGERYVRSPVLSAIEGFGSLNFYFTFI